MNGVVRDIGITSMKIHIYVYIWMKTNSTRKSSSLILDQNKSYYDNNQGNHEIHDNYKMSSVTLHCFLLSNFGTGWVKN